jgi:hypothetical protein
MYTGMSTFPPFNEQLCAIDKGTETIAIHNEAIN